MRFVQEILKRVTGLYLQNSMLQDELKLDLMSEMKKKLPDEVLQEKLIPSHSIGCRRLTPGVGYLEVGRTTHPQVVISRH